MLYLETASPCCLESIRTYRSDVSRNILGVASTEQRERGSLLSTPCPGMILRFLTSNGLCHGFSWCSRSKINASKNTCLLNPVTTSDQNGKVLLIHQSVNNMGKCSQDRRDDDSAVKILLPKIWLWLAACPWTAHTTLCPCSWEPAPPASIGTLIHLHTPCPYAYT